MRRRLPGLALCGTALFGLCHAAAAPHIDLAVTVAWNGWSRPGRMTELDIWLGSDAATRATLDIAAGRQSTHAEIDLEAGRVMRLHIPVGPAQRVVVGVAAPGAASQRREVEIAQSESPVLGVGLAAEESVLLDGFHSVKLAARDLPYSVLAHASVDALILDAPTLDGLDQRQFAALLGHAAGCGRIVLVGTDTRLRHALDAAAGCGRQTPMLAASLAQAREMLTRSLATSLPAALTLGDMRSLARPAEAIWTRVAVGLAVYFAAAALALIFFSSLPVLLLTPALAATLAIALLLTMQAPQQLVVWSEGVSGAPLARYQAWQQVAGLARRPMRVPVPPQLAAAAQPCEPALPMRLDVEAGSGLALFANFETRLFQRVSLCHSGSFPMARAIAVDLRGDGSRQVRNAGSRAWPRGQLLNHGRVQALPALDPGASVAIDNGSPPPPGDAALQTALQRTGPDGVAALWALELSGLPDRPAKPLGWLLVAAPTP